MSIYRLTPGGVLSSYTLTKKNKFGNIILTTVPLGWWVGKCIVASGERKWDII